MELTAREWALLEALALRAGRIVPKADLERLVHGFDSEIASNALEVHVSSLRRKLGRDLIETVRGLGYRLRSDDEPIDNRSTACADSAVDPAPSGAARCCCGLAGLAAWRWRWRCGWPRSEEVDELLDDTLQASAEVLGALLPSTTASPSWCAVPVERAGEQPFRLAGGRRGAAAS